MYNYSGSSQASFTLVLTIGPGTVPACLVGTVHPKASERSRTTIPNHNLISHAQIVNLFQLFGGDILEIVYYRIQVFTPWQDRYLVADGSTLLTYSKLKVCIVVKESKRRGSNNGVDGFVHSIFDNFMYYTIVDDYFNLYGGVANTDFLLMLGGSRRSSGMHVGSRASCWECM